MEQIDLIMDLIYKFQKELESMENALNNAEQAVKNRKLTYDFDLW
jgi:hypothetical protein